MQPLTPDELARTAHELAFILLERLPEKAFRRTQLVLALLPTKQSPPGVTTATTKTVSDSGAREIAEGLSLLEARGYLVQWPPRDDRFNTEGHADTFQLTRLGLQAKAQGHNVKRWDSARQRLGVDLHAGLAGKLDLMVRVGAFEQAALIALRAVEERVRSACGDPRDPKGRRLTGVALMRKAFGVGGPLADVDADPGEVVGTMELFTGAFGAVRNVVAHTETEWTDSVEAAEYVLLADLLMRILDRAEAQM